MQGSICAWYKQAVIRPTRVWSSVKKSECSLCFFKHTCRFQKYSYSTPNLPFREFHSPCSAVLTYLPPSLQGQSGYMLLLWLAYQWGFIAGWRSSPRSEEVSGSRGLCLCDWLHYYYWAHFHFLSKHNEQHFVIHIHDNRWTSERITTIGLLLMKWFIIS